MTAKRNARKRTPKKEGLCNSCTGDATAATTFDDSQPDDALARKRIWCAAGNRWTREGKRQEADAFREIVRLECQARGMTRPDALQHSWDATMAAFPPKGESPGVIPIPITSKPPEPTPEPAEPDVDASGPPRGLYDLPSDWPALPANASLAADIAWVQSNRLAVVEEQGTGPVRVHLDRSHEPAPSRAALGWLETSVRSYAKYVEIASKAATTQGDEAEGVRRERMALDDIRALLDEMSMV